MDSSGPSPTSSLPARSRVSSSSHHHHHHHHQPAKRIRVTQACDQCRDVKRRCDVAVPRCSSCAAAGQLCTYARGTKKRGTQPGYMRALETALAWVLEDVPGSRESLQRLLGGAGGTVGEIQHEQRMGALRTRWRESPLFEDMSAVLRSDEWMMGAAASHGSTGGRTATSLGAATGVSADGNTPSTMCESDEEAAGQWPIL